MVEDDPQKENALGYIKKVMPTLSPNDFEIIDSNFKKEVCHDYTFGEEKDVSTLGDALDAYDELQQPAVLFMSGATFAHSAKRVGSNCYHRLKDGPVIKCDPEIYATANGYDKIYYLPEGYNALDTLIKERADIVDAKTEFLKILDMELNKYVSKKDDSRYMSNVYSDVESSPIEKKTMEKINGYKSILAKKYNMEFN
jgi:hypothetical protein